MAEAALIDTDHGENVLLNSVSKLTDIINHPVFRGTWEIVEVIYKSCVKDVIKILETHNDVCRLYLLVLICTENNNAAVKLQSYKIIQPPIAKQIIFNLKDILIDADPIYLDLMGEYFAFNEHGLSNLIGLLTSNQRPYPKVDEYMEHVKANNIVKSLTDDFSVENFLTVCPNPVDYYYREKVNSSKTHYHESMSYLCEKFNLIPIPKLCHHLSTYDFNLTMTDESLASKPFLGVLKKGRRYTRKFKTTENIEFLKEVTFIEHRNEILNHIENKKAIRKCQYEKAKSSGNLITCMICYNDELLLSEVFPCTAGHLFCSPCIKKGIEVAIGDNKINFKCFLDCNEEFNESIIKKIVDDKLYQRVMRLKQAQEIRDASIEGLETCAFCDYSVILPPDIDIIFCLNPECKKETCRKCREENHRPFSCDQVEKTPEVVVRTMIENKMTEVLIRTCYNCNRKFVKEDGCNQMTCLCGKNMCYICRKPVESDHSHFYHERVEKDKCPLHTDENIVHTKAVEVAARIILKELKEKKPELLKKIDINKLLPTVEQSNESQILGNLSNVGNVNQLLATIIGQKVEDINNLEDIRLLKPQSKKAKYVA